MTVEANANSALQRKQAALAEKRAEALRANLKRRKNQSSGRSENDVPDGGLTVELDMNEPQTR